MKYNVVISRTYATEIVVDADNTQEVHDWLESNDETINHEELEQCNIINTDINIELITPSPNEYDELQSLAYDIKAKLKEYSHVEDYIPKEMWSALEKMNSPIVETYKVSTNINGSHTEAFEYVKELNKLIGRDAFKWGAYLGQLFIGCNKWTIVGTNITNEEINRLNLRQDFIID